MTDHLESARTALRHAQREPIDTGTSAVLDAVYAVLNHLESLGKPPTSELDELRGKLKEAEEERDFFDAERCKLALAHDELADKLASEQAREGMRAMNRWTRCLTPFHALHPEHVCDKPLKSWADGSWRCPDGHYNSNDTLVREGLGRLVRDVWVVWARDQDNPKPHHLLPWDDLGQADREVDRRIGETLLGIRDWRVGQTLQKPALDDLASPPAGEALGDSQMRAQEAQWCCTSNDPTERFFAAQNAAINAAPPQAETGGEKKPTTWGDMAALQSENIELRRLLMHRVEASRLGEANATIGALTSERDAMRVQLEAAGALERPEHAWRRGVRRGYGRGWLDFQQGTVAFRDDAVATSAPYEPPTGAK